MNEITPIKLDIADILARAPGPKHETGLHFGLDEEFYHADTALGSGSIRDLFKCAMFYWQDSWMNPLRESREETPALLYGRALHKLVLEGPEAFKKAYACEPSKSDYPEAMFTATDIEEALRAMGQKVSGNKAEKAARLKIADPDAVIFDDIMEAFESECAKTGASKLKPDVYQRVVASAQYIRSEPRINEAFSAGKPEVSIFWDVDGVRLKARLDYLRLDKRGSKFIPHVTDLKSYANMLDKPPEQAVIRAIAETRLDLQAASYLNGCALIPQFLKEGRVFGADNINAEWLAALESVEPDDWVFSWAFYQKEAPIALMRSVRPKTNTIQAARMAVDFAITTFREHVETYGTNWRFVDPIADPIVTLEDLPKYLSFGEAA